MEGDVRTMQDDYMDVNVINLSERRYFLYSYTYYLARIMPSSQAQENNTSLLRTRFKYFPVRSTSASCLRWFAITMYSFFPTYVVAQKLYGGA